MSYQLQPVKPFIGAVSEKTLQEKSLNIIGFCYDGSTSFRPGTRFGPDAIRDLSIGLEDYSPYLDDELTQYHIVDLGNLDFYPSRRQLSHEHFEQLTQDRNLQTEQIKLLTLGGEHSISYTPVKKYLADFENLLVLHLDAHTDLRDGYLGDEHSHASVIKRITDHFQPGHQLIQYGIRSGPKEEFQWMKDKKTLRKSLKELCNDLAVQANSRPIYLTLDLDFFDPCFVPGTGTPEAGGENFLNFMEIVKILQYKNFVGADVVELCPQLDPSQSSTCFAAKVCRELLLAMGQAYRA